MTAPLGNEVLSLWTIFRRPSDFPDVPFLARRYEAGPDGLRASPELVAGETLGEVRRRLPFGLVLLPRSQGDLPSVVESWI